MRVNGGVRSMTSQSLNQVNHEHTTQAGVSAPPTSRHPLLIPLPPSRQGVLARH